MFSLPTSGELVKMKFVPCEEADFSDVNFDHADAYTALINPETFDENYEVKFDEKTPDGAIGADLKYKKMMPDTIDLSLVFDSTGILQDDNSFGTNLLSTSTTESVPDQIKAFKKAMLEYQGGVHQPRYVVIYWGLTESSDVFKGRLTKLTLNHTLFHSDGTPIRTKAKITLKRSIDIKTQQDVKKDSSPDLTHIRIVKEGDTLPLMTSRIYGDPKYYLEVARVNRLTNFRKLEVGSEIVFPPIDKSVA
ncbi:MAG: LysM peptidoglycan-binding domain-containing protein [Roseivirga sp.]|nr:LysM peptidoglycan-binding domain-containing protein [Roseivirga sp.]